MSGSALAASLASSLAWPIVVLVIVFVLRKQLGVLVRNLADRMAHLARVQTPVGSAEFDSKLLEVKKELDPVPATTRVNTALQETITEESQSDPEQRRTSAGHLWLGSSNRIIIPDIANPRELEADSPEATVLASWNRIEIAVQLVAYNLGIDVKDRSFQQYAIAVIASLGKQGVMPDFAAKTDALLKLAAMRNLVAHRGSEEITKLQAVEYAVSAIRLAELVVDAYNRLAERDLAEVRREFSASIPLHPVD
jgi:hypothetical protein